jgi:hypothetical protein
LPEFEIVTPEAITMGFTSGGAFSVMPLVVLLVIVVMGLLQYSDTPNR